MLCFILPAFKFVKKNQTACCIYVILFVNYLFCYNIPITDLLVDTLLPLQGMSMLFFLYSECFQFDMDDKKENVSIFYAIPFLCTSIQIKNSGIFFVAIACIIILISLKHQKTSYPQKIITVLSPFLSLYLWKAHCNYLFASASTTKHAMTVDNYKNVFASKTKEEMDAMLHDIFYYSVTGKELYHLLAFLLCIGLLAFLANAEIRKKYYKLFVTTVAIYVSYMIGMGLMYLFSMPGAEATNLAGIGRYRRTIFTAIYYLLLLFSLKTISVIEDRKKRWFYLAAVYAMLIVNWRVEKGAFTTIFAKSSSDTRLDTRLWIQQAIDDYRVPDRGCYLICVSPDDMGGYMYFVCRYILSSKNVTYRVITESSQLDDAGNYDYMFIHDEENEIIREWTESNYPHQIENSVIKIAR